MTGRALLPRRAMTPAVIVSHARWPVRPFDVATVNDTDRYGNAEAVAFLRMHPKITSRGEWDDHDGPRPTIDGTLIRLQVECLPGNHDPKPVWLWTSKPTPDSAAEIDHWWAMYVRRFDLEHTFRFLKQTLGWTRAQLCDTDAADRWTTLVIAAYTQLRLARPIAAYAPKPSRAGPRRPKGHRNRFKAPIQPIGKQTSPG